MDTGTSFAWCKRRVLRTCQLCHRRPVTSISCAGACCFGFSAGPPRAEAHAAVPLGMVTIVAVRVPNEPPFIAQKNRRHDVSPSEVVAGQKAWPNANRNFPWGGRSRGAVVRDDIGPKGEGRGVKPAFL